MERFIIKRDGIPPLAFTGKLIGGAASDSDTEQAEIFFRARDRADARRQVLAAFPNAKFFN